uniref:Tuftelin 1a n=1 Tax=Tetraodon nigroviridis TaxID=99883 RepID=H3DLV6_TETNG
MNGVTRSLCTFEDIRNHDHLEGCRRLRLTLHNQSPGRSTEQHRDKPIGRAFALVQPPSERPVLTPEPVKSTEEQVEVIKVSVFARKQDQQKHQESLKIFSMICFYFPQVRYCLKTLREQMATKNKRHQNRLRCQILWPRHISRQQKRLPRVKNHSTLGQEDDEEAEKTKLREVSKRLYAQLQEAEKKHQEEKERLQSEGSRLKEHLNEQEERLKTVEGDSERKDQRIQELHRLLGGMEQESAALRETIRSREEELGNLRRMRDEGREGEERAQRLEKEVAVLKEKIHHLDDMLKSQQRKVRHMIEQLQNSRMVIQERDRVIQELEEKVAFLEAENREMHDQIGYFLGEERSNSYLSSERNPQIVYSKPIKPSNSSNKSLPFIKVIEIKS